MNVPMLDTRAQHAPLANELRAAFDRVLASGQYVLGPEVEALESELAEITGCKHTIGLSSGTDALIVALMAAGIGPGDEVLVPDFTFFATAGSVARLGAHPVFCDIQPDTFNLDVADAQARLTERTKAIMPVHLYGQCADMDAINALAKPLGLHVIEDAAQAIGAEYQNRPAGSLGHMAAFSFYPTKNLGALGDAGLLTTNDDTLVERARLLRVHGSDHTYRHEILGGNFRMDAFQGALLREKLKYLPSWNHRRATIACHYLDGLKNLDWLLLPSFAAIEDNRHAWHQFTLRVPGHGQRDALREHLKQHNIASGIYYPIPLSAQPCFSHLPCPQKPLPQALLASKECLSLPIHGDMSDLQVEAVIDAVRHFSASAI